VAGDDSAVAIDQDRHIEVEGLDAVGDLPDLFLAVEPRVRWVRLKFSDRSVDNLQTPSSADSSLFGVLI
jgi:hypothetical protein